MSLNKETKPLQTPSDSLWLSFTLGDLCAGIQNLASNLADL